MEKITLHDKTFRLLLREKEIDRAIAGIAARLNRDFAGEAPLFLSMLNGAFMFTSDLLKRVTVHGAEVSFVKLASYDGTASTGKVRELIGLKEDITGRTVVILEDIIDSGRSMEHLLALLQERQPKRVAVATLFYKPKALVCRVPVDYYGIALENDFIVGRGLDYNGLGRNYPDLYVLES